MRLAGRVVVVTGASAGIGRETAARLARRGATVVAAARDLARLERLAEEVPGVEPVRCDLSVPGDRAALIGGALDRHGRVDVLVNNAGVGWTGLVERMPAEAMRELYEVNLVAVADLCRLVLPGMLDRRRGDVVNVSSIAGFVAIPGLVVYASTKFAVNGLTEGLRREVRGRGVRVHLVTPGPVRTEWLRRSIGWRPEQGASEERSGGVPAAWVARAVERCLARPWPRLVSVPRGLGAVRLGQVTGVRQAIDLAAAAGALTATGLRPRPPE